MAQAVERLITHQAIPNVSSELREVMLETIF